MKIYSINFTNGKMKMICSAVFLFLFKSYSFDSIYNDYEYRNGDVSNDQSDSDEYYQQSKMDDNEGMIKTFKCVKVFDSII